MSSASGEGDVGRQELEAALEVRRELGLDYEPALVDSFAEKIEAAIETRVDARLAERQRAQSMERRHSGQQLALGIVSLAAAIPISIVGLVQGELPALVIAWIGIAIVNIAYSWQGGRR